MFTIPLANVHIKLAAAVDLCYELHGSPNTYYNFISDQCYSVNAHYALRRTRRRDLHIVDQITFHAANSLGQCVDVVIELDGSTCQATANEAVLSSNGGTFDRGGVHVQAFREKVLVSVPSCGGEDPELAVEFIIKCRGWRDVSVMEFEVHNGKEISSAAHGLIG